MAKEFGVNLRELKIEDAPYLVVAVNRKKVLSRYFSSNILYPL